MAALALCSSSVRIRTRSPLASWKAAAEQLRTHEEIITNMGVGNHGALSAGPGHEPFSERRLATGGGNTSASAQQLGGRTGPERGLDGGRAAGFAPPPYP